MTDFTNFQREFKAAQVAAGMEFPKTKDLVGISKMLGHAKISTTIRYLNIDETDKIRIAQVVDEIADSEPVGSVCFNITKMVVNLVGISVLTKYSFCGIYISDLKR